MKKEPDHNTETAVADPAIHDDFAFATPEGWRAAAEESLKGTPIDKVLRKATPEGITAEPIYPLDSLDDEHSGWPGGEDFRRGALPYGGKTPAWKTVQVAPSGDTATALAHLSAEKERGLDGCLWPSLPYPLNQENRDAWTALFAALPPDQFAHHFDSHGPCPHGVLLLKEILSGHTATMAPLVWHNDPLSRWATAGHLSESWTSLPRTLADTINKVENLGLGWRVLTIDGLPYANAGASAVEELAAVVASGATYLSRLTALGIAAPAVARHLHVQLATGSDFFMQLAKYRAFRILWHRVLELFGTPDSITHLSLQARTTAYNKSSLAPHTNLLRATTETLAAVLGGCQSVTVDPFRQSADDYDTFSRRVARNISLILREECELTQVIDPAGGSPCVEELTHAVAEKSWSLFQSWMATGGMDAALQAGLPQKAIAATHAERVKQLGQRRFRLVAVNSYPSLDDQPDAPPPAPAATSGHDPIPALTATTLAAPYEALRRRAAACTATVRLINLGAPRDHKARADFSKSFFETMGLKVYSDKGYATAEAALDDSTLTDSPVAVLCSSDTLYPEMAPALAVALKKRQPKLILLLAGAPGECEQAYREAGIDDFIHLKTPHFDFAQNLLDQLEKLS
jgi:methylmalonyl-CoA mutase